MITLEDTSSEIRMLGLRNLHGVNYWSRSPVTHVDLAIGKFDEISSAEVDGFTERLLQAMPGLVEHRCSLGVRGGFVTRLRRGTYAPHILEHVALELQAMVGHDVGFGRTRAAGGPGEYTVVIGHRDPEVAIRAAAHALTAVQVAFAGSFPRVDHAIAELRILAARPASDRPQTKVRCGLTGSSGRIAACDHIARLLGGDPAVVELSPAYLLNVGLSYHQSNIAVILDADLRDVPHRFREADRAARLVSILADAVVPGGVVVIPSDAPEVAERVRSTGRPIALFSTSRHGPPWPAEPAVSATGVCDGRIVMYSGETRHDLGPLSGALPVGSEVAATLAAHLLNGTSPHHISAHGL